MQFNQLLLICSVLVITVYSFPTGTEQNKTTNLPQNETSVVDTKGNKKPLIFIMEEKDPKSDSVVVQFVYSSNGGNSIVESKPKDKDKYIVDHPQHAKKTEEKSNMSEKEKSEQTLKMDKTQHEKPNEPKTNSAKVIKMMPVTSLTPEETSPLSGKLPKYLYDALNPVQPFPELYFERPKQMNTDQVQNENADSYLPYPSKQKNELRSVAGPRLSPLSIYDREFNVPIFD